MPRKKIPCPKCDKPMVRGSRKCAVCFGWTPEQAEWLRTNYAGIGKAASMEALGKTEASIRAQASKMGLRSDRHNQTHVQGNRRGGITKTGRKRPAQADVIKRNLLAGKMVKTPESIMATYLKMKAKQPKQPALGMRHSPEAKRKMSEASRKRWADPTSIHNSPEFRQGLSNRMSAFMAGRKGNNAYSRCRRGYREGLGDHFFRSAWEANYARYLEWMKARGEIHSWDYEAKTFWFEEIRRGVRSYTPDFEIYDTAESTPRYVELKGWMDAKSQTKLKRMAKYHPGIRIEVVGEAGYKQLTRELGRVIPNWETKGSRNASAE